jgi:hypothetical protein
VVNHRDLGGGASSSHTRGDALPKGSGARKNPWPNVRNEPILPARFFGRIGSDVGRKYRIFLGNFNSSATNCFRQYLEKS